MEINNNKQENLNNTSDSNIASFKKSDLKRAQKGDFAVKEGAYSLAIRVSKPIIDPGARLELEVYVSGYGLIESAKVGFYPSPDVYDPNESQLFMGLREHRNTFGFGGSKKKIDQTGSLID